MVLWRVAATAVASIVLPAVEASGTYGSAGVQKVIDMLEDMSVTTKKEKQEAEVQFAAFTTWCSKEGAELKKAITENGANIQRTSAQVGKLDSDVTELGQSIGQLQDDVSGHTADKEAAEAQRKKDNAAYLTESQDFAESVDALERAVEILTSQNFDRSLSEESLLQVSRSDVLPEKAKALVASFAAMGGSSQGGYTPPNDQAHGYEFQTGGVITMLKKLLDDFRGKLSESQKNEKNSAHAFSMVAQDLTDSIENKNEESSQKQAVKARKEGKRAQEAKQLASTKEMKVSNEKTHTEVSTECREKQLSFTEKQNLRAEEIEAIAKATEILSGGDVLGKAGKHLALAQARGVATALLQMSEISGAGGIVRRQVRDFLRGEGGRLHNTQLTLLAERIAADPFAKVKKLIDDMITRLLEEANTDSKHEGFCDTEMGKSKLTRVRLLEEIDQLTAATDDGNANVLRLTEENSVLSAEVADLEQSVAEATSLRTEEKGKNAETVADAKSAQSSVEAAIGVLRDFYSKASTATGFVQVSAAAPKREFGVRSVVRMGSEEWNSLATSAEGTVDTGHKDGMQTFGEAETGQQDEAQYGVVAMLEVILSDFSTLQAETEASEGTAKESHERFLADASKNQAQKRQKIEMNEADKNTAKSKLQYDTASLKSTQDESLAADRYHKNLIPQCVDQGMTFEERTAARRAEVDSLKQALELLAGPVVETSA